MEGLVAGQGRKCRTTGDVAIKGDEWSEWEASGVCWACSNFSVSWACALEQRLSHYELALQ